MVVAAMSSSIKKGGYGIGTLFRKAFANIRQQMSAFKKKLRSLKDKILKKLHLTKEEREKLFEKLKLFKRKKDKVRPTGDSIEEVNKRANITERMFQGDMALSEEQQRQVLADINGVDSRSKRQAFVYNNKRTQWFRGFKYFFDDSADEKVRTAFKKAADLWMAETCIDFKHVSSKMTGIKMKLSSNPKAKDRENIEPDQIEQFALMSTNLNYNYNITYDYGSVMHYGATSSSVAEDKLSMVPKDVRYTETLGSPFISFYDLLMMNIHYNCSGMCRGKVATNCQNNGFVNPRNCSKCVCPSGYGGDFCEIRPPGCGAELNATGDWKPFVDEIGNRTAGDIEREDFMKCNYWIKAPIGKKIEVKTVSFTFGHAVDGCRYAGVEIKTHSDQRLSGYRFCTWNTTTLLTSESNLVPVITYNRKFISVTRLEYRYV
ncbi:Zinc metalloproteinase [Trichostrongylus colubriformis]|uniref:Zinc metalloproteinase n=1 Tax=Trichostrongylus colubriformis TaxID=6319 RepID=A0AAN8IHD6_TRICO